MTTNILLTLIAVLLLAQMVLQVWQGKETLKRAYAAASKVENIISLVEDNKGDIMEVIRINNNQGYELVQIIPYVKANNGDYSLLVFTRKKIKSYME